MQSWSSAVPDENAAQATAGAAEAAARESYSRLLAWVAVRTHDLAAAEDALSEAFVSALRTWPKSGVPTSPEAWLLTAARHHLVDGQRRHSAQSRQLQPLFEHMIQGLDPIQGRRPVEPYSVPAFAPDAEDVPFRDERLRLMFVCAHPAIEEGARTPLMLQAVLGL